MNRYYYDLHVHSCLSPCGDDESTPCNIAGMATVCGLNIVALTDHNTSKNCPAFFAAAKAYGVIPIAGMELTTSEDIHVVCLFEDLSDALRFDEYVDRHRLHIKNKPDIFGNQHIMDADDSIIGEIGDLLINATDISVEDVAPLVADFGGVCYPAHVDRDANGIVAILGTIPKDVGFNYFEIRDRSLIGEFSERYGIPPERFIVSSDAHDLGSISDEGNFFELYDEPYSGDFVRKQLFDLLRRQL